MYVTMDIAFPLLIAASNIVTLFNARPLGVGPSAPSRRRSSQSRTEAKLTVGDFHLDACYGTLVSHNHLQSLYIT